MTGFARSYQACSSFVKIQITRFPFVFCLGFIFVDSLRISHVQYPLIKSSLDDLRLHFAINCRSGLCLHSNALLTSNSIGAKFESFWVASGKESLQVVVQSPNMRIIISWYDTLLDVVHTSISRHHLKLLIHHDGPLFLLIMCTHILTA
jgi:hypothetical protein